MTIRTSSYNNNVDISERPIKKLRTESLSQKPSIQPAPAQSSFGMLAQARSVSTFQFSLGLQIDLPKSGMRSAPDSRRLENALAFSESKNSTKTRYHENFEVNVEETTKTLLQQSSWREQQERFKSIPTIKQDIQDLHKRAAVANCKIKDDCIDQLNQLKDDFLESLENPQNFTTGKSLTAREIESFSQRISDRISQLNDVQNEFKYNLDGKIASVDKFEKRELIRLVHDRRLNTFFFKIREKQFLKEIDTIYEDQKNYLQPELLDSIRSLITSNHEYDFCKKDGIPGLHAEIQALNLLLKKLNHFKESFSEKIIQSNLNQSKQKNYISKLADINDHIIYNGIRLITVKTRDNAPGSHFKACKNCTGILENLKIIHGITPEVPSGYVAPKMRFKIPQK